MEALTVARNHPTTPAAAILTSLEASGVPVGTRPVDPGGVIYSSGDADRFLFFALEGLVRVHRTYGGVRDGRRLPTEATMYLAGGGEVFGNPELREGGTHEDSATALTRCRVAVVRKDALGQHLRRDQRCALALLEAYSVWARRGERAATRLLIRETRGRLADLLLELSARFGGPVSGGIYVGLRLTHKQLARMVACTRESVSKEMALFGREGATENRGRGRIVLLDRPGLAGTAEHGK